MSHWIDRSTTSLLQKLQFWILLHSLFALFLPFGFPGIGDLILELADALLLLLILPFAGFDIMMAISLDLVVDYGILILIYSQNLVLIYKTTLGLDLLDL